MSELDARLEEGLRALAPATTGDWPDVVRRSHRLVAANARRRRRLTLAFAVVALLVGSGTALAIGSRLFGWFSVSTAPLEAPTLPEAAPYILGNRLYLPGRMPQRLAAPLLASLLGQDATLVVAAPDGRHVAYHAWEHSVPLLFVHDDALDTDRLLARGAQTVAWARDGRIAYVQGVPPRYRPQHAFRGKVMVQRLGGAPTAWTPRVGSYQVLAWAGDRLLVAVPRCLLIECAGDPEPGVYVLGSSGHLAPLGLATLAALSPDGRVAFGRYDRSPGDDNPSALVRLVDVARRRVLSTLDLAQAARKQDPGGLRVGSLASAVWRDDEIAGTFLGAENALVFLRVQRDRLTLEQTFRIRATALPNRWGLSFGAPFFTGGGVEIGRAHV